MHDVGRVERAVSGLEFNVHGGVEVEPGDVQASVQHLVFLVFVGEVRDRAEGLRARDDAHTAVFDHGFVHGQPQRYHVHRFQFPVLGVLVPRHFQSVALCLGDEVAGKQYDIRADDLLNQVQERRMRAHPEEIGIPQVRHVLVLRALSGGKVGQKIIHMLPQARQVRPGQCAAVNRVAVIVILSDLICCQHLKIPRSGDHQLHRATYYGTGRTAEMVPRRSPAHKRITP